MERKKTQSCIQQNNETFVAIDFETADRQHDSACAVALVRVESGKITYKGSFLIRPPRRYFVFTYIHKITWSMVSNQPTFAQLWPDLEPALKGASFLAAHNARFDKSVLNACCKSAGLKPPEIPFECTVSLARKTWGIKPTTLPDVCQHLGIELDHHDALSDAMACAQIVMEARSVKA